MLDELIVENLGLIRSAHLEPGPGLVAVTGETGAGKTLLLGALRLLRGDAARTDRIGPAGTEARVEGRFLMPDGEELAAGRRIGEGRSRAYLNGSPVPARVLEERLGALVEIVGQNEHVSIGREQTLRLILDGLLDADGRRTRRRYDAARRRVTSLQHDRRALGGDHRALERERDLASHQAAEIEAARLRPGEDAELTLRLERLRHAEEITSLLERAHGSISGEGAAADALGEAVSALRRAAAIDPELADAAATLEGLLSEATEAAGSLRGRADAVEDDPEALEQVHRRLAELGDLRRKYGDTLDEVAAFGAEARRRSEEIKSLLASAGSLDADLAAATAELETTGEALAAARRRAAATLADTACGHLQQLGLEHPVVEIRVQDAEPGPFGADRIELRFASDAALEPGPVARVASGGELSRLVLAMRLAGGVADAPVVAFDEVDAGVGGATALAMGEKLARLGAERQVLVVTHLPQVAAFADGHLVVVRDGGSATVRRVEGTDRVEELTRMLGGLPESRRGRSHAGELLALAADRMRA